MEAAEREMTMAFEHKPVLLQETVSLLADMPGRRFLDGTLGGGGHTSALLALRGDVEAIGIDRDPAALTAAGERLASYGSRFRSFRGNYSAMGEIVHRAGWEKVDGILLDLGVSSPQIDTPERGFSFRNNGPLDMRMDPDGGRTAADLLNECTEKEIADSLYRYGEERRSRQIARAVVERRTAAPWRETGEFAALVEGIVGHAHQHGLPLPRGRSRHSGSR